MPVGMGESRRARSGDGSRASSVRAANPRQASSLRGLSVHDEIWRQLPHEHAAPAAHGHVRRLLETRLHDAGSGEGRLLDLGCGDGRLAGRLAEQGALVTGVDPSPAALERARRAHPQLSFSAPTADGRLPLPDASFDIVTCVHVLEHAADTQALMSEARRVLTSGGLMVATVPYHGRVQAALVALTAFERHFDPLEPVLRFYTARSLRALLEEFGFEDVETSAHDGPPLRRQTLLACGRRAGVGT
jgi:ubiquinone/menaquinone biosynthesis C-methylase UbiE